jgi:hypothetical protein
MDRLLPGQGALSHRLKQRSDLGPRCMFEWMSLGLDAPVGDVEQASIEPTDHQVVVPLRTFNISLVVSPDRSASRCWAAQAASARRHWTSWRSIRIVSRSWRLRLAPTSSCWRSRCVGGRILRLVTQSLPEGRTPRRSGCTMCFYAIVWHHMHLEPILHRRTEEGAHAQQYSAQTP